MKIDLHTEKGNDNLVLRKWLLHTEKNEYQSNFNYPIITLKI
ncbi:unnamed protein product [marine sediment metagenome]|uniref:Uncharacterized protein n=1 Tax=marine sediment metagenome TaxID=412755 RepID=X1DR32_9ZZZZ